MPPKQKKNVLGIIGSCVALAIAMAVSKACREERAEEPVREQQKFLSEAFWPEQHTLYTYIKKPVSAKRATGMIELKPGDFVLVTARSSQFARVIVNDQQVIIPLSATDLPQ